MSTPLAASTTKIVASATHDEAFGFTRYLAPVGRVLLAAIFVMAAAEQFNFSKPTIGQTALASIAVPVSGLVALFASLSIGLGYKTRLGAWLVVLFLVPVAFIMHIDGLRLSARQVLDAVEALIPATFDFWAVKDPMMARMQQLMLMRNLALLGGALLLVHFGAGPLSLDARRRARAREFRDSPATSARRPAREGFPDAADRQGARGSHSSVSSASSAAP